MSKLKRYMMEESSLRQASNMVSTLESMEKQRLIDADLEAGLKIKIKLDVSTGEFVKSDLRQLSEVIDRMEHRTVRKTTYKAEFERLKLAIVDVEIKDEIQVIIDDM